MLRFARRLPLALTLLALSAACTGGGGNSSGGGSPALLAIFPLSGAEIVGDTVVVQGRVTPGIAAIRVAGLSAPVSPSDGRFAVAVPLAPGRNALELTFVLEGGSLVAAAEAIVVHRVETDVVTPESLVVSPAGDRAWYLDRLPDPRLVEIDLATESRRFLGGPLPTTPLSITFVNFPPPRTLVLDSPRNRMLVFGDGLLAVDLTTGAQTTITPPPVVLTNEFRIVGATPSSDPDVVWVSGLMPSLGELHLAPLDLTTDTRGPIILPTAEAPTFYASGSAFDAAGGRLLGLDFDRVAAFDLTAETWATATDLADGPSTDTRRGFAFDPFTGRVVVADRIATPRGPELRLRSFSPDDVSTLQERRFDLGGTSPTPERVAITADPAHGGFSLLVRGTLLNVSATDLGTVAALAFPGREDLSPLPERMFRDRQEGAILTLVEAASGGARLVAIGDRDLAVRDVAPGVSDLFKPIGFDGARRRMIGLSTNESGTIALAEIDVDGGEAELLAPIPTVFLGAPGTAPLPGSAPTAALPLPSGFEDPVFGIVGLSRDPGNGDVVVIYADGGRLRLDRSTSSWQLEPAAIVFPGFAGARPTEDGRMLYAWSLTNPDDGSGTLRIVALDIVTGASEFLAETFFAEGEALVPLGAPVLVPTGDAALLLGLPPGGGGPRLYEIALPQGTVSEVAAAEDDPFDALAGAIEIAANSERCATISYRRTGDLPARPGLVQVSLDTGEIAKILP